MPLGFVPETLQNPEFCLQRRLTPSNAAVLSIAQGEVIVKMEKGGAIVPESVLKKQKRSEEWALVKKQDLESAKKNKADQRKLIYNKAKLYAKEYEQQVSYSFAGLP
ncbi:unnamed protein product [Fraxinus pennsylvanica]|uniref:Large ribosomal subunit protein uL30 N-terminal eukaryotes domain-containing protein n=1 Tax=Fraxinus pennsylvanica TaxID=56036 RepID=A0AAD1YMJ0_9LAMI|nr:unnamed protein product [Fraxinus pennsylvanica]